MVKDLILYASIFTQGVLIGAVIILANLSKIVKFLTKNFPDKLSHIN